MSLVLCFVVTLAALYVVYRKIHQERVATQPLPLNVFFPSSMEFPDTDFLRDFAEHDKRMCAKYQREAEQVEEAKAALTKIHQQLGTKLLSLGATEIAQRAYDDEWRRAIATSNRLFGQRASEGAIRQIGL